MNHRTIAVSLLVLAAPALPALAQSSVTLFGIADLNLRSVKNGDQTVYSLSNNGMAASRLGLRGVEDLGGGLRAAFWLEHGLNLDVGLQSDASKFWNRRTTVSLLGDWGELRLGRDQVPSFTGYSDFDAFGTNGVADGNKFANRLGTAATTLLRADNLVAYFAPAFGNITAQVAVAAGEGQVGGKYVGGRVGYAAGPVAAVLSYGSTEVAPDARGEDKFTVLSLGGAYDFGSFRLLGYWSRNEFSNLKQDTYNIGATVPLGQGVVRVSYISADASGTAAGAGSGPGSSIDGNDSTQVALGYVYNLSRRTALYATYAKVSNDGRAAFAVAGVPALPNPNVDGRDSTGYEFGVRHSF